MEEITFKPVGVVHSPFRDRFGIPRQPGLIPAARGTIELLPPCNTEDCVRGLDAFSHIWVVFHFHRLKSEDWRSTVRPPRLGGNRRVGVFASRSPFRPNALGLSVLQLDGIDTKPGSVQLAISGLDLIDGTPVLDIKPYVPYVDAIPDALPGFAKDLPTPSVDVHWREDARTTLQQHTSEDPVYLEKLITDMIALDPRPAYREDQPEPQIYRMQVADVDVEWQVQAQKAIVRSIASPDTERD